MFENQLVSILMPVRNAESFLKETITSVLSQDYSHWELLLVDDFSTDNSFELMRAFTLQDERIRCFRNKDKGIIPALQLGFDNSIGSCISRMDADDLMPPTKLTRFVKAYIENPQAVITGKVSYFSEHSVSAGYRRYENWLNKLVETGEYWSNIYRECVIASPNWLVSRTCFENYFSFSELDYPEDYDMAFKWYELGYEVKAIPILTHLWREHPARTSRNAVDYQQAAFFKLKTNRFADLELTSGEALQLIGAGDKGKMVAKELLRREISFIWFDIQADKYKVPVLNQRIIAVESLKKDVKSILTVWPMDIKQQEAIRLFLEEKGLIFGKNLWLF